MIRVRATFRVLVVAWTTSLALSSCSGLDPRSAPPEPLRESLFDGRSLAGWSGDPAFWSVRDGSIVGESTPDRPCSRTTYLVWQGPPVEDFELEFEFRIEGGNSGVQFRSRVVDQWDVAGYQADIEDGPQSSGSLYEQYGRGVLARRGQDVLVSEDGTSAARELGDPELLQALILPRAWNRCRVEAIGDRSSVWINDHRMCELVDRDRRFRQLAGILALQLHGGPPMRVEYRNLDLRRMERPSEDGEGAGAPCWIWYEQDVRDNEIVSFGKEFDVRPGMTCATLRGTCDDRCDIFLNETLVATAHDWRKSLERDVTAFVRTGGNSLTALCRNDTGPAGFWAELAVTYTDGSSVHVRTDDSWLAAGGEGTNWSGRAYSFGAVGGPPWGVQDESVEGAPDTALGGEHLALPEGFVAELLYSVPQTRQGSWVSMTFDPKGRIIASDQCGGLFRLSPPSQGRDGGAVHVEVLDLELGEAQGLLHAFDSLYVVVNSCTSDASGLYRVRDVDGDDRYDSVQLLRTFVGSGEHGPHAVILGPTGEDLCVVGGNHTDLPSGLAHSRVPTVWEEDQLLPQRPDPNGHAVGILPPGGWVCRTDPDGKEWELLAAGLRNAYDAAFDVDGELFTFDSDMEWDVGLPWYRPIRLLHLVSGADFGWRTGSGVWPEYYPDSLPSLADMGLGSPTGLVFGSRTAFPNRYRQALFAADWANGTIHAFHLIPKGASFACESAETFVQGKPLPIADLAVGPDGALYFVTGGRNLQSGVYRVTWRGDAAGDPVAAAAVGPDAGRARGERHRLEAHHRSGSDGSIDAAWPYLDHADPFLRHAARLAIEHQDDSLWAERALGETRPAAAATALIALIRNCDAALTSRIRDRLAEWIASGPPSELLLAFLRGCELSFLRGGAPDRETRVRFLRLLEPLFPSLRADVNRELCQLLVYLDSSVVVPRSLELMQGSTSQEEQIGYAFAFRTLTSRWTPADRDAFLAWCQDRLANFGGGASFAGYRRGLVEDAVAHMTEADKASFAPLIASLEDDPQSLSPLPTAAFVKSWKREDLAPLLDRVRAGRTFSRGREAFQKSTCLACHRIGNKGGSQGPDLSSVGRRFGPKDLLESILAPSAVIADPYQDEEIWTVDDRLFVGRIERSEDEFVQLRTAPPQDETVRISVSEIAQRRRAPLSRMPEGLLDVLSQEEIFDLLAYVLSGGDPDDPCFSGN